MKAPLFCGMAGYSYNRLYDRVFDNSKFNSVVDNFSFTPTFDGLEKSLKAFINKPERLGMNRKYEAWCDIQAGEFTSLKKLQDRKTN